jgi:hypothetical protein
MPLRPPFFKEPPIGDHVDPETKELILEFRKMGRSQTWALAAIMIAFNIPFYLLLMDL